MNDAPVADDASASTDEDTTLTSSVTASDVEGDELGFSLVGDVGHGALSFGTDGSYSYTPDLNFNGSDSFSFKANDGELDSNVATVSLTINPVNDAPVASDGSGTTDEDTPLAGSLGAERRGRRHAQLQPGG